MNKFRRIQPGVLGERYYKFLVENRSDVAQLMETHRDEMESKYDSGMSSAWLMICLAIGPFLMIWAMCGAILYSILQSTDEYLMLNDYYKED